MKASLVLIGLVISIFPMVALASGQVESALGEESAEDRFNRGMGSPWIVSEKLERGWHPVTFSKAEYPEFRSAFQEEIEEATLEFDDLALLGYVTIASGNLTVADPVQTGFTIPQAAGIYPIYGVIDSTEGLKALYIDLAPEDSVV
ncbi:MAG: hypothetical protein WCY97_02380 [Methanothrix sp.]|jgi:hypothetical protein|uniref:Uncharacterized protein n=1 Tax=Methanothrix harundinacea TaxID=301375 RepID=A0A101IKE1_9EURY|nr:MAG: hypothetical protein APR56_02050 [Methanosaeta sp. SDB]KUK45540.1 MAG: hypothetical protein XD72_0014 [Methanothrix harundinacea]MDD2638678.1 hypothetical protein [Methanothrix sp.]MDI9398173.1 hypothetical protein [Euryarchaeota archaeon]KUK96769.1 MAG: hypothetical protein XE07_0855 [Methanothrix harundinacea]